ncbi:MAG: NUDIX domain-containing protein [Acidimicrobiales bacterium]
MSDLRVHAAGSLRACSGDLALARAAIVGARAGDSDHEAARARILAFVDSHPDALHRSCAEGHLTGSALVVDVASRAVLLLFHTKVQRWLQPGGHADGDGHLAHVAVREAEEESGIVGLAVVTPAIDLDVHVFHHADGTEEDHLHLDVRHLVLAPPGAHPAANHESQHIRWVQLDDLVGYDVDDGTHRMARAGMEVLDALIRH